MKYVRDRNGIVHISERYRVSQDEYDDITRCYVTVSTIEFPQALERGFTWVTDGPTTCIACIGEPLCSKE